MKILTLRDKNYLKHLKHAHALRSMLKQQGRDRRAACAYGGTVTPTMENALAWSTRRATASMKGGK